MAVSNNKRVAKNTILLYIRMIFILGVTLFTSRVVLKTLGISDFGIYNVVGGFVSMLAYLNASFVGANQRFMAFALGKGDKDTIISTFATAKKTHLYIAIIIFIVAETFGLWFVNNKLVIEASRMVAANWVYQCSVFTLIISIINIPYSACIVAHEHLHIYAYVSVIDVLFKLLILYLLLVLPGDKLITYALLHVAISLILRVIYAIYCRRHFEECKAKPSINKPLLKEMASYAGWTAVGSMGYTFKDQFSNIILNGFFGTTINAARGLSLTVSNAIVSFSSNFFMAFSPQITKQYAAGNTEQSQKLVYAGSKYSFFLLSILAIPVIINIDYILKIWLDIVPDYTASFIIITLISSLVYSLTNSTTTAIQATGNIRVFQIGISVIMMLELPIAYFVLKAGYAPPYAVVPVIFTNSLALIFRFYLLKKLIPSYSLKKYFINIVFKCFCLFALCFLPNYYLAHILNESFVNLCVSVFSAVISTCLVIYILGLDKGEKDMIKRFVVSKIGRLKR